MLGCSDDNLMKLFMVKKMLLDLPIHSFTRTTAFVAKQQPHLSHLTLFISYTGGLTSHADSKSLFSSTSLAYSSA